MPLLFQVSTLKEEVKLLKADRERVSSSMKDIIHGAEGYKVGSRKRKSAMLLARKQCSLGSELFVQRQEHIHANY